MKKIVEIEEVENEGFMALMGEEITCFCMNYIYAGRLIGVNKTCILLENPKIVYETGPFTDKKWKDAQALPDNGYVQISAIEFFGKVK